MFVVVYFDCFGNRYPESVKRSREDARNRAKFIRTEHIIKGEILPGLRFCPSNVKVEPA